MKFNLFPLKNYSENVILTPRKRYFSTPEADKKLSQSRRIAENEQEICIGMNLKSTKYAGKFGEMNNNH